MIIRVTTIYQCEHCKKIYLREHFAKKHEVICTKNPDNERCCFGCIHLGKRLTTVYGDDPRGGETRRRVGLLFCSKIRMFLYPPKVEHDKSWFETEPVPNNAMKRECEFEDQSMKS